MLKKIHILVLFYFNLNAGNAFYVRIISIIVQHFITSALKHTKLLTCYLCKILPKIQKGELLYEEMGNLVPIITLCLLMLQYR